jgi:hypothetical protein
MRWTEHVAGMEELRNAWKILVGKPEGKKWLWRLRPFSHWGDATAIRSRKKVDYTFNSWRVVIASWSRWWEKRHYELKVRPVGYFFLIESQSRRLSGITALGERVDNIIMDQKEIGCEDMDWIHLAHNMDQWWALVCTVVNLRGP